MSLRARFAVLVAAAVLLALAILGAYAAIVWNAMPSAHRELFAALAGDYADTLVLLVALLALASGLALAPLHRATAGEAVKLAQGTRIIATANPALRMEPTGTRELADLARAINLLAERYAQTAEEAAAQAAAARDEVAHDKNRLAALVEELAHAVVVCNMDGVVLLYNRAARALFTRPDTPIERTLLGLGRSIFTLIDRTLVAHAVERLELRARRNPAQATVHFVTTTPAGAPVRTQLAAIRGAGAVLEGYILTFSEDRGEAGLAEKREGLLQSLAESGRAALANVRAAAEALDRAGGEDASVRAGFLRVIGEETDNLARRIDETARCAGDEARAHWALEEIACSDLLAMAREHLGRELDLEVRGEDAAQEAWVRADGYVLLHVLATLARRLHRAQPGARVFVRTATTARHVELDVGATMKAAPPPFAAGWEAWPVADHGALASRTLRQALAMHEGEAWHQYDPDTGECYFRMLLPPAPAPRAAPDVARVHESRPEFYDFDLFHHAGQSATVESRRLADLAYTVFDTETTGLQPSQGDEIVAIGAVRIVNGRVLAHEAFEQLVDPGRPLSARSARITGIDPAMVRGQPGITEVLPLFHRYCEDTVLVAHNAAFDMRFLELKEKAAGTAFTQPVLDTLLLSAVLHPALESHQLEAIAERHGVSVIGRHTALGDALVTAEIFLRMIPQLAERGIVTLRDAQEASRRTFYARVSY